MKLAVVGGGSTYTPELVDGIARLSGDSAVPEGRPPQTPPMSAVPGGRPPQPPR